MIRVIAFDLDDTLYPEKEYVLSGFKAVSEFLKDYVDIDDPYQEFIKTFNRGERKKTFDVTLKRLGVEYNETLIQDLVDCYRAHFPNIQPYDDVVPILHHLKGKYHLALITDGYLQAQRNKVRVLDIEQFFEKIVYTDAYSEDYWKPSPFSYRLVMENFLAEGNECAYIADNIKKDFIAPNKLGWLTVQIKRKEGQYLNTLVTDDHKPHVRINSLRSLQKVLKSV
jgi:putative hydrolase of the HAD superfamily